mmetsp:Transcript_9999/g.14376  ORF Transcript_9999/g.14376 Transcript_9999/m.14376 type:complete len:90 (-) Transcript_9999:78-347(-)
MRASAKPSLVFTKQKYSWDIVTGRAVLITLRSVGVMNPSLKFQKYMRCHEEETSTGTDSTEMKRLNEMKSTARETFLRCVAVLHNTVAG